MRGYTPKPYYYDYSTDEDYEKAVEDWEYVCDMIDEAAEDRAERRRGHII